MRASLTTIALGAAITALLLAGCADRQRIAEQTVVARGRDAASEIESSQVPPELLTWEQVASIDTGLDEPRAIAVGPNGRVYVGGDEELRCFTADGEVQWALPVDGEPRALAVAADGSIVVGFMERVDVYDQAGQLLLTFAPDDRRTWITSVAVDDDDIFVGDAGARKVWRYDRQGNLKGTIGERDPERGIPMLYTPSPHLDVAIAGPDKVIIVNPGRHEVQYHSLPNGDLLHVWGDYDPAIDGLTGCCNPTDIALLPDGRLVASEKGMPRVKVYTEAGELQSVVVPPEAYDSDTEGIDLALDASGRVLALDPLKGVVTIHEERTGGEAEEVQA